MGCCKYIGFIVASVYIVLVDWKFTEAATLQLGCIWRSSISATLPETQEIAARCREGHLFWYYPKGRLLVRYSTGVTGQDFLLCLKYIENSHVEAIYRMSGQARIRLPLPAPGNDTCISSQGGNRPLLFQSPTRRFYYTDIHYTITPT